MKVMDGVGLNSRGILPGKTERGQATFHFGRGEPNLLPDSFRAHVAVTHGSLGIAPLAAARLGATSDDECGARALAGPSKRESVKRWFGRWIELRADVAASYGIVYPIEQPPLSECLHVMLVEDSKSILGEGGRRPQFARAKRSQRSPRGLDVFRNLSEPLRKRHRLVETHPLDLEPGIGGGAAGILKHCRDEPVVTCCKFARHFSHPCAAAIRAAFEHPWRRSVTFSGGSRPAHRRRAVRRERRRPASPPHRLTQASQTRRNTAWSPAARIRHAAAARTRGGARCARAIRGRRRAV